MRFRDERDWKQYHKPKDMALSLVLEAAELLEEFQWKGEAAALEHVKKNKEAVADELADVLYWVLLMAHDFEIDLVKAAEKKLRKNAKKYPVRKARGRATKYSKL
jgi:dCTP diphosphatase